MACGCTKVQNVDNFSKCPVCLLKLNNSDRFPFGLNLDHNIICRKCLIQLHSKDKSKAFVNEALLYFIGFDECDGPVRDVGSLVQELQSFQLTPKEEWDKTGRNLLEIAKLSKEAYASRALLKKIASLIIWFAPNAQKKIITKAKSLGNRILFELLIQNQVSNHRAQQQLWSAIRSKACQFMGPALQDEALKLVLLALEDGSALSRKVLIMFVVQRLNPQFPQASKTSVGHVIQLLYRSGCFHFTKEDSENLNLMTLKEEYRSYEALREAHDVQIIRIGLEAGLHFNSDQWSHILYGDNLHKSQMQSILDKLTEPQTFAQLTTQFLIQIQRVYDEEISELLIGIYPCFVDLAAIDCATIEPTWENAEAVTTMVCKTFRAFVQQKKADSRRPKRKY